ncbi:hypothetical protein MERGE_000777 [Pneumocystis wakefieldiae]|uniref:Mitochondrial presequence protease n=1 Tax=Pneumocystis wakefieldiae TaxID=38082 RepID=A0A899G501_9ASCO|nr:hypothetical protein MERGE_000777 [Pneumocystis wakefieldiae]
MTYFIKIQDFEAYERRVRLWRSIRTGIQENLCLLQKEIFNDSGCPHTLEHLIFLGSRKYPYKGVLDFLANRSFAQGTNAWTETDHTAYTISTAGTEGFLRIFPIYIDHILFPTLTYDGFYTEIHHIDGEGNDSGVVYSEMQAHENTLNDLQLIHSQRALFPEGSGYRSYTGGNLEALRALDVETVRKYHSEYYLPQNLCIIVAGKVDVDELFYVLDNIIEPNILHNLTLDLENWKREIVPFPDIDETAGEVLLGWLGPPSTEFLTLTALNLLGKYLTDSAISVLQKELVEVEDQFCSDISFSMAIRLPSVMYLNLFSVPTQKLERIEALVFDLLNSIMHTNETDLDGIFTNAIITHFLYGDDAGDTLKRSLQDSEDYERLKLWTVTEWLQLLNVWLIQNFHICIISKPSARLSSKLEKNEKTRLHNQRKRLGKEGLRRLKEQLRISQEKNDVPFPLPLVSDFKIPNVKNISFIKNISASAGVAKQVLKDTQEWQCSDLQKYIDQDSLERIPLFLYFNHINSKFVTIQAYVSSEHVSPDLKPYLGIYLDNFFLNGVIRSDGTRLTYEEVVRLLENETVDYDAAWGISASFLEVATIQIKVEIQNYKKGILLLRDLFYGSIFEPLRNGNKICWALMRMYQLDENLSTSKAINLLSQINFLTRLKNELEEDPDSVVEKFRIIQSQLFKPENIYFQVISDISHLEHPVLSWKCFSNYQEEYDINMSRIPYKKAMLTEKGRNPSGIAHILSLSTVENSYSVHVSKLFSDFNHKDFPAFILLLSCLNIMEGILWKHIRGAGLAYSVSFKTDIESGFVYYSIYSSPNVFNVWEKTRAIINDIKNKEIIFDDNTIINAKSSLVYDIVSVDSTPFFAAQESFVSQVIKNQPENKRSQLIDEISNITMEELYDVHNKYLVNLFNSKTSDSFIVTTSSRCSEIMQGFSDAGYDVTEKTFNDY